MPPSLRSVLRGGAVWRHRIYIAVPGKHLLLHDNHILLRRGPRLLEALIRDGEANGKC